MSATVTSSPPWSAETAIGGIRLALEAAADEQTAIRVIQEILEDTEPTPGNDTAPVECLVHAIREDRSIRIQAGGPFPTRLRAPDGRTGTAAS